MKIGNMFFSIATVKVPRKCLTCRRKLKVGEKVVRMESGFTYRSDFCKVCADHLYGLLNRVISQ